MNQELSLKTRREFLHTTLRGGALSWTVPTFLARTFAALGAEAAQKATPPATGVDSNILVVLQLAGGNDGLNTVVPYANDHYHRARPKLGLTEARVLKLNDAMGLASNLTGLKELYDGGHLAIVQGVGYPNPNRSHFRSTEIWQTASERSQVENGGWLGRYFDNTCPGCDPTLAINIGAQMPLALAAKHPAGLSLHSPQTYRFFGAEDTGADPFASAEQSLRDLNRSTAPNSEAERMQAEADESGGTIGTLPGGSAPGGSALDFLERTALDAQVSSEKIRQMVRHVLGSSTFPSTRLGHALKLVSQLIGGGLPTRVFYVSQGGYDTHVGQANAHQRLLKDLGDSLRAFVTEMHQQGNLSRVLVMTFSEFGRRVAENASGGTDHGAAAPLFLVGNKMKAGLLGRYPSLAPADLHQGDLQFTVDFRSIYAGILESWLKTRSEPILGRKFTPLDFLA